MRDYGEERMRALGQLHGRVHVLVLVETTIGTRVISFRKANAREMRIYNQEAQA